MFEGNVFFILKLLPILALAALLFTWFGWWLRCKLCKCGATQAEVDAAVSKVDGLQTALKQAESRANSCHTELSALQGRTVDKTALIAAEKQIADLQTKLDAELRIGQKSREDLNAALTRNNEGSKKTQEKIFVLETELSKAREECLRLKGQLNTPAPSAVELEGQVSKVKASLNAAMVSFSEAQRERDAARRQIELLNHKLEKAEAERIAAETRASFSNRVANHVASVPKAAAPVAAAALGLTPVQAPLPVVKKTAQIRPVEPVKSAPEQPAPVLAATPVPVLTPAAPTTAPLAERTSIVPSVVMDLAEAAQIYGKRIHQDDLKLVEGIGPKIEELMQAAGIQTWLQLANSSVEKLKSILAEAGERFAIHDPSTWPQQCAMMAEGRWKELKELQDELDGGRVKTPEVE